MNPRKQDNRRPRRPKPQTNIRVLVVDDDPEIRDILRERLLIEGFQVVCASSGEEALAKFLVYQSTPDAFDVVTLDIRMRDLSGRQVLSLLRKIDQRVCILMISGLDDLSQAVQSLSQGADDYLSKPIKIWDIRDRLTTALGRRASLVDRETRRRDTTLSSSSPCSSNEEWSQGNPGETPVDDTSSSRAGSGVEWGTAISPSDQYSIGSHEDTTADTSGSSAPDTTSADTNKISEPASSLRGFAGQGKPASEGSELIPPTDNMGRETDPGNRIEERGTGENCVRDPQAGDRGGDSVKDPVADRRALAHQSEPTEGGRPGSPSEIASQKGSVSARTPLECTLELARHVESSWEGCEGHGEEVARLLEKLGASLATTLELTTPGLDGLCLAARLHGLGMRERQDENSREWNLDLSTLDSASQSTQRIPGRGREDAGLVARILCALLAEEENQTAIQPGSASTSRPHGPAFRVGVALLGRLGKRQHEEGDLDPALRDLLRSHLEEIEPSKEKGPGNESGARRVEEGAEAPDLPNEELDKLLALYEVADGWIHLTHQGIGGMTPNEAFPELCAALTSQLPAHPTSMALAYLRTQI